MICIGEVEITLLQLLFTLFCERRSSSFFFVVTAEQTSSPLEVASNYATSALQAQNVQHVGQFPDCTVVCPAKFLHLMGLGREYNGGKASLKAGFTGISPGQQFLFSWAYRMEQYGGLAWVVVVARWSRSTKLT